MKKNLFTKYFLVSAVSIVLSFALLMTFVVLFAGRFWGREKLTVLHENVEMLAHFTADSMEGPQPSDDLRHTCAAIGNAVGASVFLTDADGRTFFCSDTVLDRPCVHIGDPVPAAIRTLVLKGSYDEIGLLGGFYQDVHYSSGAPLYGKNGIIGMMFVSADAKEYAEYVKGLLGILFLSAGIALLLMFTAVYVFTLQMTRPLREMSRAAYAMEHGDFSHRVAVRSKDEVGELAVAFNKMAKSLAQLEQMRRSFVANVSHELKTPMTTIGGFIDGILDGTIEPDRQEYYLRLVSEEIQRLSRMVNSMLVLARLESGEVKINRTQFNLTELICRTLIMFEQRIEEKRLEIRGLEDAPSAEITADADLLYQVFYNLTDNAVKFTPAGGFITFCIACGKNDVQVSIRNSGEGIPQREWNLVFDQFYKTDKSRADNKNGTGLGLYIVKSIVEAHEGSISVQSKPGEYTEFFLRLPASGTPDGKQRDKNA